METKSLILLQQWFLENCDEQWEHQFGVTIETSDNPGWIVNIDLEETRLEEEQFSEIMRNVDDDLERIHIHKVGSTLRGVGGPDKLTELLALMTHWLTR